MTTEYEAVTILPITDIAVAEDRQRQYFPESEMADLKESILSDKGLMCPILVRPTNKKSEFMLVAGERRLRTIATFDQEYRFGEHTVPAGHVPCVVKYFSSDMSAMEAELHENIIRLDLTWQEKAQAIARLHELKTTLNPRHTRQMTVDLIDDRQGEEPSTRTSVQKQVNNAILVTPFLSDKEVAGARDLKEASKIVSRRIEEEAMKKLRELQSSGALVVPEVKKVDDVFTLDELAGGPPQPVRREKVGVLLEGDMREKWKEIAPRSINVFIADPPYGMDAHKFNDGGRATQEHKYDDTEELALALYDELIDAMDVLSTDNAHAYIFCDIDKVTFIKRRIQVKLPGWWVRRKPLIWSKGGGKLADGTPTGYTASYECVVFAMKGERRCSKVLPDVLAVSDEKHKHHAAQKPVELYKTLLGMSGVVDDRVLDPFAGSGTVFRAAPLLGLKPIGIEMDPHSIELCKMAQEGRSSAYDLDL